MHFYWRFQHEADCCRISVPRPARSGQKRQKFSKVKARASFPKDEYTIKGTKIWGYHADSSWMAGGTRQHNDMAVPEMLLAQKASFTAQPGVWNSKETTVKKTILACKFGLKSYTAPVQKLLVCTWDILNMVQSFFLPMNLFQIEWHLAITLIYQNI